MINSIVVYCGAQFGNHPAFRKAAIHLGRQMAKRKIRLVYGGSNSGLMITIADTVLDNGGSVLGIFPSEKFPFSEDWRERLNPRLDNSTGRQRVILVDSMPERKQIMSDESDVAIALAGGFGTMDETYEHVTGTQLKLHIDGQWKPCGLLNTNGFYDLDLQSLDHKVFCGFINPLARKIITDDTQPSRLLTKLEKLFARHSVLT